MNTVAEDILMHYGIKRRSGRYPWGSGEDPYQRSGDFISRVNKMKKEGFTYTDDDGNTWTGEKAIYKSMGLTSGQYRQEISLCKAQRMSLDIARAKSLKEDGLGPTEIGRRMGVPEGTVRAWLKPDSEKNIELTKNTVDFLREQVDKKGMVDVGTGVDRELGISKERLEVALYYLQTREGYPVYSGRFDQVTNPNQKTTQKVLCVPGKEHKDIYDLENVHSLNDYVSHDGGETFDRFVYPKSMDSKRLMIRYKDDKGPDGATGDDKDGVIEIRRGVDDLSLGNDHYAQVRILVDNNRYLKGMAVYSDDMPDGVDVVFNTNKGRDVPVDKVLKEIKSDPDNPFGALIKAGGQSYYTDANGERQMSLINKTRATGDWSDWKDTLPSQFLGKQSLSMAKQQLNLAKADKLAEFDEYCSLTNPTVKKHLLSKFADECDSASVHLKAAALPGQKYHVMIPVNTLKDNEVYAPGYENGTKLALIRYPHGGTFEIPILTVNNKHAPAKKLIGADVMDAVGINKKNADRLSGADFDGDTVMCIPTHDKAGKVKVTSTPPLKGLEGFDPKMAYGTTMEVGSDGSKHYYRNGREVKIMSNTNTQMGIISNLITDMTLAGASQDELARAVRHSMVVIDAEKHKLDYKQSEQDNNIAALKKDYQRRVNSDGEIVTGGASTILSRAKGEYRVDKRQGSPRVNQKGKPWYDPTKPEGANIYKTADDVEYQVTKTNKRTGEVTVETRRRTQNSTNMAETDDAYSLVSANKYPMETVYADYANSMKSLANKARMEVLRTSEIKYSASAKAVYQKEVDALDAKLVVAESNAPRERAAQRAANIAVKNRKESDPSATKKDLKKVATQALTKYRSESGSMTRKNRNIEITDREWEAIQAGAISPNQLRRILNNTDVDKLRERATPRTYNTLSTAKQNKISNMRNSGYTLEQIAKACGCSTSTVQKYMKGGN